MVTEVVGAPESEVRGRQLHLHMRRVLVEQVRDAVGVPVVVHNDDLYRACHAAVADRRRDRLHARQDLIPRLVGDDDD